MSGPQEKRSPAQRPGILRKLAGWALGNFNLLTDYAMLLALLGLMLWEAIR